MTRFPSLTRTAMVVILAAIVAGGVGWWSMASAHEHREVQGTYTFVVGFLDEPAFAGQQNGLSLRISTVDPTGGVNAQPVEGAEATLQAEVTYGDESMPLTLEPVWNTPGSYQAIFFPTTPGNYRFRIWGTIDGTAVDETFDSADGEFGPVEDPAPLMFPKGHATPIGATPVSATPAA